MHAQKYQHNSRGSRTFPRTYSPDILVGLGRTAAMRLNSDTLNTVAIEDKKDSRKCNRDVNPSVSTASEHPNFYTDSERHNNAQR